MQDFDKNKESSYLQYWDVNHSYRWEISQKLPVNNFEWIEVTSQFNQEFIKNYNEKSDKEYYLKVDVQYTKKLHELQKLPEIMKIQKVEKIVVNLHDKNEYVIHIRNLK